MADVVSPRWMRLTLLLAGLYNIAWGSWVALFPGHIFAFAGMAPPNYPWLWQTVGMTIGVFGVAYLLACQNPLRHWPVVAAGVLGRVLGPLGFFYYLYLGEIPWAFGATLITNDALWLVPFTLILLKAYQTHAA
jgi:small multidrug resistance pump